MVRRYVATGVGIKEAIARKATAIDTIPGLRLWTDDFNNLFQILK